MHLGPVEDLTGGKYNYLSSRHNDFLPALFFSVDFMDERHQYNAFCTHNNYHIIPSNRTIILPSIVCFFEQR